MFHFTEANTEVQTSFRHFLKVSQSEDFNPGSLTPEGAPEQLVLLLEIGGHSWGGPALTCSSPCSMVVFSMVAANRGSHTHFCLSSLK